mmetsp:Transcript_98409/g.165697  ORF Transcript_98409/g.165697 Transcript_98409/m.165697 type:complete len:89 (-) Transcript_98409:593-859(-)|eukprot:CAMPEP_0174385916 /NCGR_PEP_ID=MMETSP0811_2-20130205/126926_1 /TAXON_ID=73025 ORGANISM="Eutreptiella gymnastica-like, Strain CCMP1594" /NCGR_SAMPLE_ID=MMETSP0811_2 /ASSEMBLY_ACC=CAM_ASM_000667 /LENGTH=88 /DNA_ID=CAMNT_0015540409 /DNA_START=124 /DNA_END=390 /DNA_ORIENTATION=+
MDHMEAIGLSAPHATDGQLHTTIAQHLPNKGVMTLQKFQCSTGSSAAMSQRSGNVTGVTGGSKKCQISPKIEQKPPTMDKMAFGGHDQ